MLNKETLAGAALLLAVALGLSALLVNAAKDDAARRACGLDKYLVKTDAGNLCVPFNDPPLQK